MVGRRAVFGALVTLMAGGLALAGCAIPTQRDPSSIPASRVPPGLGAPNLAGTTTQPNKSSIVQEKVFLLGADRSVVPVLRFVQVPASLTSILTAMLAGPTRNEEEQGITSAIPTDVDVLSVFTRGSVVTVNFNLEFGEITGANAELAVAQVVYTVASQNGLGTGVLFEIDGVPTPVLIASGEQVSQPVTVSQFVTTPTTG